MVDGSWQAYDEFIEDVVEHGDDGEQVKVVSLENLLCSYNMIINEEELSLWSVYFSETLYLLIGVEDL